MNSTDRRRLLMAERVREFTQAHPLEDPSEAGVIKQLEYHLARAQMIVARQQTGLKAARGARARRVELRRAVHFQLLRYLTAVGGVAAKDRTELAAKFKLPNSSLPNLAFAAAVKEMLGAAKEQQELLVAKGMGATLLDDLDRMVKEFEAASSAALTGRRDHIGARTDLDLVTADLQEDVRVLNGIYSYRFGKDPELMAEWDAVRFLPTRPQRGPDSKPEGGVAPAA
jgi:hypothetical protein